GTVSVLSTVVGDRVRAIAVAADVITGGRTTAGVRPGHRVLDLNWWSWLPVTGLAYLPWWVRVIAVAAAGLFLGSRHLGRRPAPQPGRGGRRRSRLVAVIVVLAGVLLVGASTGVLLLPTEAAPVSRPAGAAVLPRVLGDQKLRPPRAFDTAGHPRTTAVSLVFAARVADRDGLYGTDAATGALVRLDDLPGTLVEGTQFDWPINVAVSPNGRFLANGILVVDLKSARVTPIPGVEDISIAWMGEKIAETVAVLDDGSVVFTSSGGGRPGGGQLWRSGPPGSGRSAQRVTGVDDVAYVRSPTAGQVLVSHFGESAVEVVDLSGAEPAVVGLRGIGQQEQVAVVGDALLRMRTDGKLEQRTLAKPGKSTPATAFDLPGGVDRLALTPQSGNGTTLVALGAGARTSLAVLRVPLDVAAREAGPVTELTRVDAGLLGPGASDTSYAVARILLAPEVIATATVTDVPAEPGWAALTESRWRTVAGWVDAPVALLLVLLVFGRISGRRAAASERPRSAEA
ncbi:MAG TPA: hypothetical protein VLL08_27380, partial [Kineosporiaceae bacterium]|nr:hypothetical protein [Kineosporiaceae bacterium]